MAAAAALLAAALLVLGPSLRGDWLWDDDVLVLDNPAVNAAAPWSAVFTGDGVRGAYPASWAALRLQHAAFGAEPLGYRVVQALLHGLAGVLLWRVLRALEVPAAWLAALLFVVHPLAVATGAWVSEQKNTLAAAPALAAVLCSLRGARAAQAGWRAAGWHATAAGLFALAMLAKPSVVTLPLVLAVLAVWRGRLALLRLPLALLLLVALAIGAWQVAVAHGIDPQDRALDTRPWSLRLAHAADTLAAQWQHVAWPVDLGVVYDAPAATGASAALAPGPWPWLALGALLAAALALRPRLGAGPLVALACSALLLAPALGLVELRFNALPLLADHYAYLALMPAAALAAAGLQRAAAAAHWLPAAAGSALAVALACGAWQRAHEFAGLEPLFTADVARNPRSALGHNNLGLLRMQRGDSAGAQAALREAARLDPGLAEPRNNLGVLAIRDGDPAAAEQALRAALAARPSFLDARLNLARLLLAQRRLDEARAEFERARAAAPDDPRAPDGLAEIALRQGRPAEAEPLLRAALAALPPQAVAERAELLARLGDALSSLGRAAEARECWQAALRLVPGQPRASAGLERQAGS